MTGKLTFRNDMKSKLLAIAALLFFLAAPQGRADEITPDGKLGLVANSVLHTPDANGFTVSPDDRLFVIDLTASPPAVVDTVTVGKLIDFIF